MVPDGVMAVASMSVTPGSGTLMEAKRAVPDKANVEQNSRSTERKTGFARRQGEFFIGLLMFWSGADVQYCCSLRSVTQGRSGKIRKRTSER
jgi:hypothetical protein